MAAIHDFFAKMSGYMAATYKTDAKSYNGTAILMCDLRKSVTGSDGEANFSRPEIIGKYNSAQQFEMQPLLQRCCISKFIILPLRR
jgi:hypothetical protein